MDSVDAMGSVVVVVTCKYIYSNLFLHNNLAKSNHLRVAKVHELRCEVFLCYADKHHHH